jgi:hypothetical protein
MTIPPPRKLTPAQEYQLRQAERMQNSPMLLAKFPHLKFLKVHLLYFDPSGLTQIGELKYSVNVSNAKCMFVFACRNAACACSHYDLSAAFANALHSRSKKVGGEVRCEGTRTRVKGEELPCGNLLRYKLTLGYI